MKIKIVLFGVLFFGALVYLTGNSLAATQQTAVTCASLGGVCSTMGGGCPVGSKTFDINCGNGIACCSAPPVGAATGITTAPSHTTPTSATGVAAPTGSTEFNNPLKFDSVEGFLSHFLTVLQRIIVVLSLVFIVIGAVMYIISAGNSGMIEKAKTAITSSLIGLTIGIAAPSFLKEISLVLGWTGATTPEVQAALTLTDISLKVLNFLLSMVGILAVLMLVVGGVMYLSSAGNEDRIDSGKNIVKNAIIGIIISLSAMVLIRQIAQFFAQ